MIARVIVVNLLAIVIGLLGMNATSALARDHGPRFADANKHRASEASSSSNTSNAQHSR